MRRVCGDYAEIFEEIEENPSCVIRWNLADHAVIGKPQFIAVERRSCVQLNAGKSDKPADLRLSLLENCGDKESTSANPGIDTARSNAEFLRTEEPAVLSLQESLSGSTCGRTDSSNMLVDPREDKPEQDTCCADDRRNCGTVSVDRSTSDSSAVISSEALPDNLQPLSTRVPGYILKLKI